MSLYHEIQNYTPVNQQEEQDQKLFLKYMENCSDYLDRENQIAHFTASIWTINPERTKTLMVYHNIYDSWSWIGGHADGMEDLRSVAMRELQEETGVRDAALRRGLYVPSHLHLNVTYLAEAREQEALIVNADENQAVKWWSFEDALRVPNEPWMITHVYKKLIEKCK